MLPLETPRSPPAPPLPPSLSPLSNQREKNFHSQVFCNGEEVLTVSGCKPEYVVDVWSGNHPFYTGALTTSVGEESRIAQFQKRYGGLYGEVAPQSAGGNTKLTYKKPDGKKKKK